MKEQEFWDALDEQGFGEGIKMEIDYIIDDEGSVILDEDSLRENFEQKLKELREVAK